MLKHKSLNISILGLVGYLKLTCLSSISPVMVGKVVPSSLLESILGLLSRILNIDAAESLALEVSGPRALL